MFPNVMTQIYWCTAFKMDVSWFKSMPSLKHGFLGLSCSYKTLQSMIIYSSVL
ncbi:hypothetical protein L9F63_007064, partial [Diploptera punctata]